MAESFLTSLLDKGGIFKFYVLAKKDAAGRKKLTFIARVTVRDPRNNLSYRVVKSGITPKASVISLIKFYKESGQKIPLNILENEDEMLRVIQYWLSLENDLPEVTHKSISVHQVAGGYTWQAGVRWLKKWDAMPIRAWKKELHTGCYKAVSVAMVTIIDAKKRLARGNEFPWFF